MKKIYTSITILFLLITLTAFNRSAINEEDLHVYPNPAIDQITIELTTDNNSIPELKIIDLTGKVVLKLEEKQPVENKLYKTSLDISSLQSGIYFIKIIQDERVYSKRLIVE